MNLIDKAKWVLKVEADAVSALIDRIDDVFVRSVEAVYTSKGRVVVTGMGKSGQVGKKIAATLASTGTPAFFMHPAEAGHGDLGMVTPDDVIIAISNSGETEELLNLIPFMKRFNLKLISMTGNPQSTLSRSADMNLDISIKEEACPMGIVPTASTTATLAMGDALAVCLLVKRGFNEEDFAGFHPGGSLGKKLFIKVSDLMHSGDSIPHVMLGSPMHETVIEISAKRLGLTTVMDDKGVVKGVVTDGDLRRGILRWGNKIFDMKAEEVMTKNPKTIGEDELAVKAIAVMQAHSITSLLVSDSDGKARGIIHLHDILKKGIV